MKKIEDMTLRELVEEMDRGYSDSACKSNRTEYDIDDWIPGHKRAVAARDEIMRRVPVLDAAVKLAEAAHKATDPAISFTVAAKAFYGARDTYRAIKGKP